ncbi:tubulin-tyrosine ligase [Ophiostoma piceae UAMH 11346]|uniref:Tubulin-tyrosine ligase n=1 Tax=Ophiostoma piceae (strain UAMH 11346) TaxID=1262450 RepID=S3BSZ0_OPHP1|nr:tubulin-tyrosine ligase [Ophiostoma piceae UAMH 11346]
MSIVSDVYRTATSKAAQRTLLYSLLLATASSVLYGIAAVGYLAFYHEYVPHRVRSTAVHLQYGPAFSQFATAGAPGTAAASAVLHAKNGLLQRLSSYGYHAPYGLADLRSLDLKMDQEYDISIVLSLPHSPANLAVGNFMVELVLASGSTSTRGSAAAAAAADITSAVRLPPANPREFLESQGKRVLFAAARPAILAYTDPLVAQAKRLALLPVHLFAPEAASRERLIVPMAESLSFAGSGGPHSVLPAVLYVELRTPGVGSDSAYELQTYGAEVVFSARLRGLRWLMYHYRIFAFLLLTTVSWLVEVAFMVGVVLLLGIALGGSDTADTGSIGKYQSHGNGNGNSSWEASTAKSSRAPPTSLPQNTPAKIKTEENEGRGLSSQKWRLSSIQASTDAPEQPPESIVKKEKQDEGRQDSQIASIPAAPSAPASPAATKSHSSVSENKTAKSGQRDSKIAKSTSGSRGRAGEEVDEYDDSSYGADDYASDEDDDIYEEDVEQPPPRSPSRTSKKTSQPSSPKKAKDTAVATGRASSTLSDSPLRQRQQQQQQQPQTPKKEASSLPISSPASLGKENSTRKKAALSLEQKQAKPA